jgi:hypothetical protein
MNRSQAVETWLKQKTRTLAAGNSAAAIGLFLLAILLLFVTFWIIYAVIYLGFNWLIPHSHVTRLWISGLVLVLLFVGNATTDRQYLETYSFTTGTHSDTPVSINIPFVGEGSTINPLAPDSAHSYVKMITSALYCGPRQVTTGLRLLGRARRLSRIDVPGSAAVLAFLATKDARVPFEEIVPVIPAGHNVAAVLEQLHEIDGVLFLLKSEPAGLSLVSDCRDELRKLNPVRRKKKENVSEDQSSVETE